MREASPQPSSGNHLLSAARPGFPLQHGDWPHEAARQKSTWLAGLAVPFHHPGDCQFALPSQDRGHQRRIEFRHSMLAALEWVPDRLTPTATPHSSEVGPTHHQAGRHSSGHRSPDLPWLEELQPAHLYLKEKHQHSGSDQNQPPARMGLATSTQHHGCATHESSLPAPTGLPRQQVPSGYPAPGAPSHRSAGHRRSRPSVGRLPGELLHQLNHTHHGL